MLPTLPESTPADQDPGTQLDLVQLVAAANQGDPLAWSSLVERLGPLVLSSVRGQGLSETERDDVFQETWLSLHAHLRFLRDPQALPKWVAVTAKRHAWAVVRRSRARRDVENQVAAETPEASPDGLEELEQVDLQRRVWAALSQMPERCRTLIEALHLGQEQPSYVELAARLGMPPGSLGPTRQRCLERLARLLQRVDRDLNS
jgi:RNA polymerase sigma factor (sigma-70 family)